MCSTEAQAFLFPFHSLHVLHGKLLFVLFAFLLMLVPRRTAEEFTMKGMKDMKDMKKKMSPPPEIRLRVFVL
jgi:hypothetical protein